MGFILCAVFKQNMEMILGVIDDVLNQFENGTADEKDDAKQSLLQDRNQFLSNLKPLADSGNAEAKALIERLEKLSL